MQRSYLSAAQAMVREFHAATGLVINDWPTIVDHKCAILREKLIAEEYTEFIKAQNEQDLTQIADALGDLLYVVLGAAVSYGIAIEDIFDEIHRSNMTKVIDGYMRGDGKWIKGPGYSKPDIATIVLQQMMRGVVESEPKCWEENESKQ